MRSEGAATAPDSHGVPKLGLRRGLILFAVLWLTFAGVHYEEPGWNVNSRFALTQAIVDEGTFIVDDYVTKPDRDHLTLDRSLKDGHYYSDKIIGTSLLGVPPYALAKLGALLMGRNLPVPLARCLTTVFSVSVFAALAGTAMMSLLLAFGARVDEALLLTLTMSFGTMLWGYSALFYSYLPSICFLLFAYNLLLRGRLKGGLGSRTLIVAGLCLGASLLCEYTVGIAAVCLSAYVIWHARPRWRVAVFWLFALIPLMVFAWYALVCFGEVCVPYKYLENQGFREGMAQGLQGITHFRLPVLYYITLHPYRGLFVLSPVLILSLIGLAHTAWKQGGAHRPFMTDAAVCAAIFIGYLWFNCSYYMWWGGWTMGPRHLMPALPFLIPPLLWFIREGRLAALAMGTLLVASIWLVGVPALVDPQTPAGPYPEEVLRRIEFFYSSAIRSQVFVDQWPLFFTQLTAWNRGLPNAFCGPWYFPILTLIWIGGAWALLRGIKTPAMPPSGGPTTDAPPFEAPSAKDHPVEARKADLLDKERAPGS